MVVEQTGPPRTHLAYLRSWQNVRRSSHHHDSRPVGRDRRACAVRAASGRHEQRRRSPSSATPSGSTSDGTNDEPGTSGSIGTFITTNTNLRDNLRVAAGHDRRLAAEQLGGDPQPPAEQPRRVCRVDLGRLATSTAARRRPSRFSTIPSNSERLTACRRWRRPSPTRFIRSGPRRQLLRRGAPT